MKKLTLTLLAGAALAVLAAVPVLAQNTPQNSQAQQQNTPQASQPQNSQQQAGQQQGQNQQQASSQSISPQQLGRNGVRQVQQALQKSGFKAGRADGIWGRNTRMALKDFQRSKGIQGSGKLNQKTLSDLGVNIASNENTGSRNGNSNGNMSQPQNQNQNQQ
jgi:peptidoglycan hydrolase-like protein with peptidoglycan-binding domain